MEVISLASGSSGNSYLINAGKDTLLIEAGLPKNKLKKKLWDNNTYVTDIESCLCSHIHQDHSKSIEFLANSGVNILFPRGDWINPPLDSLFKGLKRKDRVLYLHSRKVYRTGGFKVVGFDLEHDKVSNFGYMLLHEDSEERLFYATDTMYIKYQPKQINYFMIEVNYQKKYLEESVEQGDMTRENMRRIMRSHMGLDTAVSFFKANDLSQAKEIHVLHISGRNANAQEIKETIQSETGVPTYIAGR